MHSHPPAEAVSEDDASASKLLAWGQAHGWPQLPFRAWAAIAEGEPYWKLAAAHLSQADLEAAHAQARRASGTVPGANLLGL